MQFRLTLAILVSVVLIGYASWNRFSAPYEVTNIVAVEQVKTSDEDYQASLNDFIEPTSASTTTIQKPLSTTEVIGRQLIMDYVGLAANGQVTKYDIEALANKYVENVPSLSQSQSLTQLLTLDDIKIVSDTKTNFQNYAGETLKIHEGLAKQISRSMDGRSGLTTPESILHDFALSVSKTYIITVIKLKKLSVPKSIGPIHLELINSYIADVNTMKMVLQNNQDPSVLISGLNMLNENIEKEKGLLDKISAILNANGI